MEPREGVALASVAVLAVAAFAPSVGGAAALPCIGAALLAYTAASWRRVGRQARVFAALGIACALATWLWHAVPAQVLAPAARQGAQFATLLAALATLRMPMRQSRLIGRAAVRLLASAPRHRYATLTYGSHFLSLMFGVGVVSMIGDMMARSGLDCRQSLAARQMLLAVVRGLAFATVWSPMAMSFAIVSTALPNLEPLKFVAVGLLLAVALLLLSCRLFGGHDDAAAPPTPRGNEGGGALLAIALMALGLFIATWALHRLAGLPFILASSITLPAFSIGWLVLEPAGDVPPGHRPLAGFIAGLTELRSETLIFCASAFIGQAILGWFMPEGGAAMIRAWIAPWLFALACVVLVPAVAMLSVAPTIVVLMLAQLIQASGIGAATPLAFAIALTLGWSLAIGVSNVSATLLIAGRVGQVAPSHIALRWNRGFTAVMLAAAMVLVLGLYGLGW